MFHLKSLVFYYFWQPFKNVCEFVPFKSQFGYKFDRERFSLGTKDVITTETKIIFGSSESVNHDFWWDLRFSDLEISVDLIFVGVIRPTNSHLWEIFNQNWVWHAADWSFVCQFQWKIKFDSCETIISPKLCFIYSVLCVNLCTSRFELLKKQFFTWIHK